jgi:hypothetical protein
VEKNSRIEYRYTHRVVIANGKLVKIRYFGLSPTASASDARPLQDHPADEGYLLLPADFYFELTTQMREFQRPFSQSVDEFLKVYPSYIEQVRPELNASAISGLSDAFDSRARAT